MKKVSIVSLVFIIGFLFTVTMYKSNEAIAASANNPNPGSKNKDDSSKKSGHKFFTVKGRKVSSKGTDSSKDKTEYKKGELLVKFKKNVSQASIDNVHKKIGAKVKKTYKKTAVQLIELPQKKDFKEALEYYKKQKSVKYAEPNYRVEINSTIPNDPMFDDLWGLHNTGQTGGTSDADIDAPEAWDSSQGNSSVIVGVVDTGVDYNHEDLLGNIWTNAGETDGDGIDNDSNGYIDDVHGWDAANNDGDPNDDNGHGTHVSGTIGAVGNNGVGVAGINWQAKIMALKFLDSGGSGWISDAIECLEYVLTMYDNGVNIKALNNSWGGGGYSSALSDAIDELKSRGILFIAAAGNDSSNTDSSPHYPSCYPQDNVISVAATDHDDALSWFSNYGATTVDLAAPGESILSTLPCTNNYEAICSTTLFFDDMESGSGSWTTGGTNNTWAITEEEASSPTHAWSDSPDDSYLDDTDSYFMLASDLDLSGVTGLTALSFKALHELEDTYDYLYVEVSGDSGATWETIGSLTGYASSWQSGTFIIPDSVKTTNFRCRFRLASDSSFTHDGVYIDDIKICTIETAFYDDMESGSGNWTTGGTNNSWDITEESAYSPTHAWSDSPNGEYLDDTDSYIKLANDIDLSGISGDVGMFFGLAFDLEEDFDYLYVEISKDSGATWQTLDSFNNWSDWQEYFYLIPDSFKTANFRCRFRLTSDSIVTYDGVYIDDVWVGPINVTQTCNYDWYSGTSMATPHVTGAAAFIAAYYPGFTYSQIKNLILNTVDHLISLDGLVLTGGRLNLYNALTCSGSFMNILSPASGFDVFTGQNTTVSIEFNDCNSPITGASVIVTPSNGDSVFSLYDDGNLPDASAGDGIYSAYWSPVNPGATTLNIEATHNGDTVAGSVSGNVVETVSYCYTTVDYSWIDATGGTDTGIHSDDTSATIPIGFNFDFYGVTYTNVNVSSNGFITFGSTAGASSYSNVSIPNTNTPNNVAAPFWDDLHPGVGGAIYYYLQGTAPNRKLTIEWYNVPHYSNIGSATFEVTLYEGSNNFIFRYQDVDFGNALYNNGTSATVGVEDAEGDDGTLYSYNTASLSNNMAIKFTTSCPPTAVALVSFDAASNGDGGVTLTWETATEVDNAGFNLYRARGKNGHYVKVNDALITAKGDATTGATYSFVDTPGRGVFYYKLEDVDTNGVSTMHDPVKVKARSVSVRSCKK